MEIKTLCDIACHKENFTTIQEYIDFCKRYIDFIADTRNFEARITSQNEHNYKFYQYKAEASFNVTRPINADLFLHADTASQDFEFFKQALSDTTKLKELSCEERNILNSCIYTLQQSIGCTLDALPASKNNTAKKINGDLFERLMLQIFKAMDFEVNSKVESIQIEDFKMNYQHDLTFTINGEVKAIGSVKTSSKDRLDKVFIDKLFYNKLQKIDIPHFAIFLGDVQRKGKEPKFSINQTFLRGHFKAYSLVMNPLDGVYYCDIRPIMKTDPRLNKEIKRLDELLCKDIWNLVHS